MPPQTLNYTTGLVPFLNTTTLSPIIIGSTTAAPDTTVEPTTDAPTTVAPSSTNGTASNSTSQLTSYTGISFSMTMGSGGSSGGSPAVGSSPSTANATQGAVSATSIMVSFGSSF